MSEDRKLPSIKHLVVVTCTRCGEPEQFDPAPALRAEYRMTGDNRSMEDKTLHQVARIRPKGWGEVTMVRAKQAGEQTYLLHHVLCPTCCKYVAGAVRGSTGQEVSEEERCG